MKGLLLIFLILACLACKNKTSSSEKDNTIKSQNEKIKALESRLNKIEKEKQGTGANTPKQIKQPIKLPTKPTKKVNVSEVPGKNTFYTCLFFIAIGNEHGQSVVFNSHFIELNLGYVGTATEANRLGKCFSSEIRNLYPEIKDISVDDFQFNSMEKAERFFTSQISKLPKQPIPFPFLHLECPK